MKKEEFLRTAEEALTQARTLQEAKEVGVYLFVFVRGGVQGVKEHFAQATAKGMPQEQAEYLQAQFINTFNKVKKQIEERRAKA